MSRSVFLSYATGAFVEAAQGLCESAKAVGFDTTIFSGPDDLEPAFRAANAAILAELRGAGYWLWKPQIIRQELSKLDPGDVLVYCDAGRSSYYRFQRFPTKLVEKARSSGFLLGPIIPQHGPLAHWTKRDAFILTGMDGADIAALPPIQATWSFWTNSPAARDFLEAWLEVCRDPRALSDRPSELGENYPGFRDHRHDQALLSLVAYRMKAPHLDYSSQGLYRILGLRPRSRLAHLFTKRIDDAEMMERGKILRTLAKAWSDLATEGRRR